MDTSDFYSNQVGLARNIILHTPAYSREIRVQKVPVFFNTGGNLGEM